MLPYQFRANHHRYWRDEDGEINHNICCAAGIPQSYPIDAILPVGRLDERGDGVALEEAGEEEGDCPDGDECYEEIKPDARTTFETEDAAVEEEKGSFGEPVAEVGEQMESEFALRSRWPKLVNQSVGVLLTRS